MPTDDKACKPAENAALSTPSPAAPQPPQWPRSSPLRETELTLPLVGDAKQACKPTKVEACKPADIKIKTPAQPTPLPLAPTPAQWTRSPPRRETRLPLPPSTTTTATGIRSKFMSSPGISSLLRNKKFSKSAQGEGPKTTPENVARLISRFEKAPSPLKMPAPPNTHPINIGITKPSQPYNPVGKPSTRKKTSSQASQHEAREQNRKPNQDQRD